VLPGLRRVDLEVNHRCPAPIVERAVRLVEGNRERFVKRIRAGTRARGSVILAPDGGDDTVRLRRVLESWPDDGSTRAVLARTNHELIPAVAVAVELGWPFRAPRIELPLDSPLVDEAIERLGEAPDGRPLAAIGRLRADAATIGRRDLAGVLGDLLAWAAPFASIGALAQAVADARSRLVDLRRDDAPFSLATAHATKGLEFDHVVVVGMEEGRFPSARSVQDAPDPVRALEEERRLAYVAWTRAKRTLTLLYDPLVPSPFLLEAFSADELGLPAAA
jgi:superfamily I DNA/RNA helicase